MCRIDAYEACSDKRQERWLPPDRSLSSRERSEVHVYVSVAHLTRFCASGLHSSAEQSWDADISVSIAHRPLHRPGICRPLPTCNSEVTKHVIQVNGSGRLRPEVDTLGDRPGAFHLVHLIGASDSRRSGPPALGKNIAEEPRCVHHSNTSTQGFMACW